MVGNSDGMGVEYVGEWSVTMRGADCGGEVVGNREGVGAEYVGEC